MLDSNVWLVIFILRKENNFISILGDEFYFLIKMEAFNADAANYCWDPTTGYAYDTNTFLGQQYCMVI